MEQQVVLPGIVDSSAIYLKGAEVDGALHDTLFATTTYGITLAIDARTGDILWQYTPPSYDSLAGGTRFTTASPVASPSRKWIYAASPDGKISKLSVEDGSVAWRVAITRLPLREKISSPLNFSNGHVIATTSSYEDKPPYQGHVALVSTKGDVEYVWNALCSHRAHLLVPSTCPASDAGIWARGGAVVVPGSGNLLVSTGNGPWNGKTNWGDSLIELSPTATMIGNYVPGGFGAVDYENAEIGSSAPVFLTPRLIAQGGKDQLIRLISLPAISGTTPHRAHELQKVRTPSSALLTQPAVWRDNKSIWLIAADYHATEAWALHDGLLVSKWTEPNGGTSPIVAGGLLYVYDPKGGGLHVYDPATGTPVATLPAAAGHWNSPIATDGFVALPEGSAYSYATSGILDIWRVPSP